MRPKEKVFTIWMLKNAKTFLVSKKFILNPLNLHFFITINPRRIIF